MCSFSFNASFQAGHAVGLLPLPTHKAYAAPSPARHPVGRDCQKGQGAPPPDGALEGCRRGICLPPYAYTFAYVYNCIYCT